MDNNIIDKLLAHQNLDKVWSFPAEQLEYTLAELTHHIQSFAAKLSSMGVKKGDRIGLVNSNSADLICLLYACWYLGAVVVPMRTQTGKFQQLKDYIVGCDEICSFKLIFMDDQLEVDKLDDWAEACGKTVFRLSQLNELANHEVIEPVKIDAGDLAIIQFSSGSTGKPKGVMVTHGMMMAQLKNLSDLFSYPINGETVECYALWAPLNHDMGMFVGVLTPMYQGTNNILAPPAYFMRNPARWFYMMEDKNVEVAMFTNSVLAKSLSILKIKTKSKPLNLSRCRIYLGAEKVSPIVIKAAYQVLEPVFGKRDNLYIGYGMAENSLGATTTLPGEIPVLRVDIDDRNQVTVLDRDSEDGIELASIGIAYENNEITVRDSEGNILPELVMGEINIASHCLSPGYYQNQEATDKAFIDGRFRTRDLGFWYQGQLYFYSRIDDLIILNGQNIVPDDIELTAEEPGFVRDSSTVLLATDDSKTGMTKLHLLFEGNDNLTAEEIMQRKRKIMEHIYLATGIIINEVLMVVKGTIEKTSSGKKRRKVIRQRLLKGQIEIITKEAMNESATTV